MDTIVQYHKKERRLLSPEFAYRAYQTTRQGSAISRYALRGVRFALQIEKDGDGSATSQIVSLLGADKSFATDFVNLLRHGTIKDPRKLGPTYHTNSAPGPHNPPIRQSGGGVQPNGDLYHPNLKRQGEGYLEPLMLKKPKIEERVLATDSVQIKQERNNADSRLFRDALSLAAQESWERLSYDEKTVYGVLHGHLGGNRGMHVRDVAETTYLCVSDVFKAGEVLLREGFIHTTVDDMTWAVVDP